MNITLVIHLGGDGVGGMEMEFHFWPDRGVSQAVTKWPSGTMSAGPEVSIKDACRWMREGMEKPREAL